MRGRPRTIDREKVIRLYRAGESLQRIADKTGSTIKTIEGLIVILKKQGEIKRRRTDRQKQGEKHNVSKLTESDVRRIYRMRIKGHTYLEIAQEFQVHPNYPRAVCTGLSWVHLYKQYKKELTKSKKAKRNG